MAPNNKIAFTPAVRESVGLWIQLVGGSGSGKTYTALRLATGISGDKPFAFIDTENRRGLHYADQFKFDHLDLRAPFRPEAYMEAVLEADKAGYPVIVIDSMSHEWAGDGGILDWQEEELKRLGGGDNVKMLSWVKPKMSHKKLVTRLLQVKAHLIVCFRAEPKIEMVKENGKTVIQEKHSLTGRDGWIPVCEKNLPFEATCSFLLMPDHPGVPLPIKLQEQHKALFPLNSAITEESGKDIAAWAAGGKAAPEQEDLETRRAASIKHFGVLGVTEDRILARVEKTAVNDIGEDEMATLKALAIDVKGGSKSLLEAFPLIDEDAAERAAILEEAA